MPAYDYRCSACGRSFEIRQKMSDPVIESCPECGGAVNRLIGGGAGIISKESASSCPAAGSSCGLGTPCCGQGGGCGSRQFCDQ